MQETPKSLDPNSEMIALASYFNTKNVLVTAIEIQGSFEESLLRPLVTGALEGFPQLRSCLKEVRKNGRHHLYWYPAPEIEFPVIVSRLKDAEGSTTVLCRVLDHLAPRLDRDWDLFHELPSEFHYVRVSEDHNVAVIINHHAAFDAATASEFGRQCLLKYRELRTGVKDDPQILSAHALSTSRKRMVRVRKTKWEDIVSRARLALRPLLSKPALPVGTGRPNDRDQYHVKRVLSVEDSERIARLAVRGGGALVDLFAASGNLAIARWNELRNMETGTVTTALTVNTRGRFQELDHSNNVSALFFESDAHGRKDPGQLLRSMSAARIRQFRKQMDLRQYENTAMMIRCTSLLPFNLRRKVVQHLVQKHRFSLAITFLGVVWPLMKNGRPTLDSYPTSLEDIHISEVHGTVYKHLANTPLVMIVYSYANRLNLVMATSASLFTRAEAEAFMDLFVDLLQASA